MAEVIKKRFDDVVAGAAIRDALGHVISNKYKTNASAAEDKQELKQQLTEIKQKLFKADANFKGFINITNSQEAYDYLVDPQVRATWSDTDYALAFLSDKITARKEEPIQVSGSYRRPGWETDEGRQPIVATLTGIGASGKLYANSIPGINKTILQASFQTNDWFGVNTKERIVIDSVVDSNNLLEDVTSPKDTLGKSLQGWDEDYSDNNLTYYEHISRKIISADDGTENNIRYYQSATYGYPAKGTPFVFTLNTENIQAETLEGTLTFTVVFQDYIKPVIGSGYWRNASAEAAGTITVPYVITTEQESSSFQGIYYLTKDSVVQCSPDEKDPTVPKHVKAITEADIEKWNQGQAYTPGIGINISTDNVISIDETTVATNTDVENLQNELHEYEEVTDQLINTKQDKLTQKKNAGPNITITTLEDGTVVISASNGVKLIKVDALPEVGDTSAIYLVPKSASVPMLNAMIDSGIWNEYDDFDDSDNNEPDSGSAEEGAPPVNDDNNFYDEFIYLDNKWEKIGDTKVDLSDYVTLEHLTQVLADYQTKLTNEQLTKIDNAVDAGKVEQIIAQGNFQTIANMVQEITDENKNSEKSYASLLALTTYIDKIVEEKQISSIPNVTYHGTPTIQGYQVSNFNENNYLSMPSVIDLNVPFEINFSFTTGLDVASPQYLISSHYGLGFAITSTGKINLLLSFKGQGWDVDTTNQDFTVNPSTTYFVKIRWNKESEDSLKYTYKVLISQNEDEAIENWTVLFNIASQPSSLSVGDEFIIPANTVVYDGWESGLPTQGRTTSVDNLKTVKEILQSQDNISYVAFTNNTGGTTYVALNNTVVNYTLYPTQILLGNNYTLIKPFKGSINFKYCNVILTNSGIVMWDGMGREGLLTKANVNLDNITSVGVQRIRDIIQPIIEGRLIHRITISEDNPNMLDYITEEGIYQFNIPDGSEVLSYWNEKEGLRLSDGDVYIIHRYQEAHTAIAGFVISLLSPPTYIVFDDYEEALQKLSTAFIIDDQASDTTVWSSQKTSDELDKKASKDIIVDDESKATEDTLLVYNPEESQTVQIYTKQEVDELLSTSGGRVSHIEKVEDYLYNINYNALNYDYAKQYFLAKNPEVTIGGCSSVRKGNLYGRNFDWIYNNQVEFVVKTPASNNRHAVCGISTGTSKLTKEFVETFKYDEAYEILPFMLADGINDAGLVCNMNVVPLDKGKTTGTTPTEEKLDTICSTMLVRYILDNFSTADEAIDYIQKYISVYVSSTLHDMGYEVHYMIADKNKTYVLEFVQNEIKVIDIADYPFITNFFVDGLVRNSDGSVYTPQTMDDTHNPMLDNHITEYGSGLERYNLINNHINLIDSEGSMRLVLNELNYTNTYKRATTPFWYTEYVGGELSVNSQVDSFTNAVNTGISNYEDRSRDSADTWQTNHSSIYDIENRTLTLVVQEGTVEHSYKFNYYTKDEVDELLESHKGITQIATSDEEVTDDTELLIKDGGTALVIDETITETSNGLASSQGVRNYSSPRTIKDIDIESTVTSITIADNTKFIRGTLSNLTINLPTLTIDDDYISVIVFKSGEVATVVDDINVKWLGNDVTDSEFTPVANKDYELTLNWNGLFWTAIANSFDPNAPVETYSLDEDDYDD